MFFPFIDEIKAKFHLIAAIFFFAIIFTLRTLDLRRKVFNFCMGMGVLALSLGFLSLFVKYAVGKHAIVIVSLVIYSLFMVTSIVLMINKMFSAVRVNRDVMRGGISVYLLIGYLWTLFYFLVYLTDNNAFSISGVWDDSYLFYFSFTTLTTLGYGDVCPINKIAMLLANLEAIAGQLYIAIFVARLVGLHIIHQANHKE